MHLYCVYNNFRIGGFDIGIYDIYKQLRGLCEDHNLTQGQLAELLKIRKNIYNYEQGKREPPIFSHTLG